MARKKIKRLKIVEQMAMVVLFSVLVPLFITGFIVNNVNQHAIRNELQYSADMLAQGIAKEINSLTGTEMGVLNEIAIALKYMDDEYLENEYLNDILVSSSNFKNLEIKSSRTVRGYDFWENKVAYDKKNNEVIIFKDITSNKYLIATLDINTLKKSLFSTINDSSRQFYIISNKTKELILAQNYSKQEFDKAIKALPQDLELNKPIIYNKVKNEPIVYYSMQRPDLTIIVNTTSMLTDKTIYTARYKIILSLIVAVIAIIFIIGMYTYYLYINIRQLFKGIIAMSKGNYKRKIRLLTSVFTPFEIVFLASEINKMIDEVNISYKKVHQKNRELRLTSNFRQNLVDTVSHEFRTPLTSIKGYTSRLLRTDIVLDEETKIKSLNTIKQQADRLSRMVEDLLVIPDIEGSSLNINIESVNLAESLNFSIESVKNLHERELIVNEFDSNITLLADKDRLIQILINIFENSNKYAYENSPIICDVTNLGQKIKIEITNQADYIDKETLNKLFEKFTRIDDKTTRTTRGTGLGLYIVKGLTEAMNGKIVLQSSIDNEFKTILMFPRA